MSFLADVILIAALVVTSLFVVSMQRRLKRLDASHDEYQRALNHAATALFAARDALAKVNTDGRLAAAELGEEIARAKALAAELDRLRGGAPGADTQYFGAEVSQIRRRPPAAKTAPFEPGRQDHAGLLRNA